MEQQTICWVHHILPSLTHMMFNKNDILLPKTSAPFKNPSRQKTKAENWKTKQKKAVFWTTQVKKQMCLIRFVTLNACAYSKLETENKCLLTLNLSLWCSRISFSVYLSVIQISEKKILLLKIRFRGQIFTWNVHKIEA